tara:strand:+ start:1097 stop:1453 length:357 start_codon:yes stop_codon:yes gene_type:complete
MVKDKNGTEIKIGDTVHYKRPETVFSCDMSQYGPDDPDLIQRIVTRPARDEVFTVTEFVDSPFVKHGGHDPRMSENRIWITGPELGSTRYGSRNAVSPLAVVKVDTFVKKAMPTFSLV